MKPVDFDNMAFSEETETINDSITVTVSEADGRRQVPSMFASHPLYSNTNGIHTENELIDGYPKHVIEFGINDLKRAYRSGKPDISQINFYKIVRGGNTKLVRVIINTLKSQGEHKIVRWILGLDDRRRKSQAQFRCCEKAVSAFLRLITFTFLFLMTIALTPIWYFLHYVGLWIRRSSLTRISKCPQLPLAFAVFGETKNTIEFFAEEGVTLVLTDNHGNNVFHYISDLAIDDPERAIRCFKFCRTVFPNMTVLRKLILDGYNKSGLTPLDYAARYSGFRYLTMLLEEEGLMRKTTAFVSEDSISIRDNRFEENDMNPIYMWEEGNRHNEGQSLEEPIAPNELLWNEQGATDENGYRICRYDISSYEQGDTFGRQSRLLQLVSERLIESCEKEDYDAVLDSRLLKKWLEIKRRVYRIPCIISGLLLWGFTIYLLYFIMIPNDYDGELSPMFADTIKGYYKEVEKSAALNPGVLNGTTVRELLQEVSLSSMTYITPEKLTVLCGNISQIRGTVYGDNCMRTNLHNLGNVCGFGPLSSKLLDATGLTEKASKEQVKNRYHVISILGISIGMIVWDICYRLSFVCRKFAPFRCTVSSELKDLFSDYLPCSYASRTLNIWVAITVIIYYFFGYKPVWLSATESLLTMAQILDIETHYAVIEYCFTVILCIKIASSILELRHLPYIGFFITTVLKMLGVMVKLVILYLVIGSGFAVVFISINRDPDCKAKRISGYENFGASLYTVYNMMIGMGDAATSNVSFIVVYIIYSVGTIIMVLNLIIAIMTAVSDTISEGRCKQALRLSDALNEALNVESMFGMWPLAGCCVRAFGRCGGIFYEEKESDGKCCRPQHNVQVELEFE